MRLSFALLTFSASFASAANIIVTVGTNSNLTQTFTPQRVQAAIGDVVVFNFTSGNHSATQSTFGEPCILAHISDSTINGFDSGFRNTNNGTAITQLMVPISGENVNTPFWFFDETPGACGQGAVGVINSNEGGNETLAGFIRNAERLNGTASSSSSARPSSTAPAGAATATTTQTSSASKGMIAMGVAAPLALFGFALHLI